MPALLPNVHTTLSCLLCHSPLGAASPWIGYYHGLPNPNPNPQADKLSLENRKLRKLHVTICQKIADLMSEDLLRNQHVW